MTDGTPHFIIGLEVDFNPMKLNAAAKSFVKAAKTNNNPLMFAVSGYDDDPRELTEIPEVMKYLRAWYNRIKGEGGDGLDRLDQTCTAILSFAVGKANVVKTPTGQTFEIFGEL